MNHIVEGLILSKRGYGHGHLLLTFLDSNLGKITPIVYGAALETGTKRSATLSGSVITGLLTLQAKSQEKYQLSDTKLINSFENLRSELKPMGFLLYTLELIDIFLKEGDIFLYYQELYDALCLFDETLDEKYILFFLAKYLSVESWLEIPEKQKLNPQTVRFIEHAQQYPAHFLKGKNISPSRKRELSFYFAHAVKNVLGKKPNSLELLRFE